MHGLTNRGSDSQLRGLPASAERGKLRGGGRGQNNKEEERCSVCLQTLHHRASLDRASSTQIRLESNQTARTTVLKV